MSSRVDRIKVRMDHAARERFRVDELHGFIEEIQFTKSWREFGLTDDNLDELQVTLMGIAHGPFVSGSRYVRDLKVDFGDGRNLIVRYVLYASKTVLLLNIYESEEVLGLTDDEVDEVDSYCREQDDFFESRYTR